MEQEQRIQEEEQLIDQSAEAADQESAEMAEEEHSEQDELMPRPAFYIEEDAENLTEEERQAFSYILAVRTQKENLLLSRKRQHPRRQEEIESEKIQYKNEKEDLKEQERTGEAVYQQLMSWNKELISNWKCVISNMKYLHKNKLPQNLVRQKLSMECLFTMPEINRICHNKWLTLPQIQNLLIFLSNAKYQALELHMESNQQMPTSDHYHLWIYSLLALHQSYASYNNFEALASVNACLLKQRTYLKGLIGQGREVEVDRVIGWGATLVLLVEAFNQRFLKSHFTLMKMIK